MSLWKKISKMEAVELQIPGRSLTDYHPEYDFVWVDHRALKRYRRRLREFKKRNWTK